MVIIPGKNKNLGKRYAANVIDYLIFFSLFFVYLFSVGQQDENGVYRVTGMGALIIPIVWIIYFPVTESLWMQTLGKKALNLYVVDFQGHPPGIGQATLRRILDLVEIVFLGMPSLLSINYSSRNQRIGDMLAGTTVISTDAICRHCGTDVELNPKEVINNVFRCPNCNEFN